MICSYLQKKKTTDDDNRIAVHSAFAFCLPAAEVGRRPQGTGQQGATLAPQAAKLLKQSPKEIVKRRERSMMRSANMKKTAIFLLFLSLLSAAGAEIPRKAPEFAIQTGQCPGSDKPPPQGGGSGNGL
jgi:hypothetical protein